MDISLSIGDGSFTDLRNKTSNEKGSLLKDINSDWDASNSGYDTKKL